MPGRTKAAPPTEAELLALLRAGDEAAFARILDDWSGGMLRVARSFVADAAADVVQDTWLAVIQGIDAFEGRCALKTWVYRILVNTAKRRRVREARSVPMDHRTEPDRFQGPGEPYPGHWREYPAPWTAIPRSPEQSTLDDELRTHLEEALAALPARQRVVITMRDVQGLTADEVCLALDLSPSNQRVLLHRARTFVRARLEVYASERA